MSSNEFFTEYTNTISRKLSSIDFEELSSAALLIRDAHLSGRKTILVGNGGSAAMASHVAVDFTKAAGIRAVNFNEADLITCFANDYGYEHWVEQALVAYADPGDVIVLISSSGTSKNILNGAIQSKAMDLSLITLSGFSAENPLRTTGKINLWVDSTHYNVVEMTHHIWLVGMVDYLVENYPI